MNPQCGLTLDSYMVTHPPFPILQMFTIVADCKGGFSGGTIASGLNLAAKESVSELTTMSTDAYYLARQAPGGGRVGTAKPAPMAPTFLPVDGTWAAPFVMEG